MMHPPRRRSAPVVVSAASALLTPCAPSLAGDLIFADILNFTDPLGNSIRRIHDDGSGLETLINTGGGVRGIDVDTAGGYIYWTDADNFVIRRAHFDGSGQVDLITSGLAFPSALRLSLPNSRMFWGDQTNENMQRASLDGSITEFMADTPFYRGLAIDNVHSVVYWTTSVSSTSGQVLKSDLVGNNQMPVIPAGSSFKPGSLAIDVGGGKIYWTDQVAQKVRRADLDGSHIQELFNASALGPPKGIALDLAAGKVYWGQDIDNEGFQVGQIWVMNLDGFGPHQIATDLGSVNDIIFVPTGVCYANCDLSTQPPILNANDFQCFLNAFAAGDPSANCDGSTAPPVLNANDFQCFLNRFAAGCP